MADEWIRKLWYIYTMEYHSDIRKSEVSQKEKHQYSILTHMYGISEKAMAPHSSTFAWKIPWMEEPGGLQSMGSLGVGYD